MHSALLRVEGDPKGAQFKPKGPHLTFKEVACCEWRSLRSADFSGASGSIGSGRRCTGWGEHSSRQNGGEPNPKLAMRAGIGQRGHHSICVAKNGFSSIDMCSSLWWATPKTPREPTLSTNTWAGGFLGRPRKDAECSMWVGGEEKQRQLIRKALSD